MIKVPAKSFNSYCIIVQIGNTIVLTLMEGPRSLSPNEKKRRRVLFRNWAAIEPTIGHLKAISVWIGIS
jgi:hypothetical protein